MAQVLGGLVRADGIWHTHLAQVLVGLVRAEIVRLSRWVGLLSPSNASDEGSWMKQLSLLARIDLDEQPSADSAAGGGGQSALLGHARSFSAATVVTDTLQQEYVRFLVGQHCQ